MKISVFVKKFDENHFYEKVLLVIKKLFNINKTFVLIKTFVVKNYEKINFIIQGR